MTFHKSNALTAKLLRMENLMYNILETLLNIKNNDEKYTHFSNPGIERIYS